MKLLGALLTLISVANCYGPHHPRGPHSHYKPDPSKNDKTKLTQNTQIVNDEMHIKEDMASVLKHEPDTSRMTTYELAFYYFKFHDFDNNTKLDGLEMLQAIKHTVHGDYQTAPGTLSPHEFYYYIGLIDRVLDEDDLDGDGYLSYIEYVLGREKIESGGQKF